MYSIKIKSWAYNVIIKNTMSEYTNIPSTISVCALKNIKLIIIIIIMIVDIIINIIVDVVATAVVVVVVAYIHFNLAL